MTRQEYNFHMPDVRMGDPVFWFHGGDVNTAPCLAWVEAVGLSSVTVLVADGERGRFRRVDGVRHVNDPRARPDDLVDSGGWEHHHEYYDRREPAKAEPKKAAAAK